MVKIVERSQNQNKRKREVEEDEDEAQNKDALSRKKKSRFAPDLLGDNAMLVILSELCFEPPSLTLITHHINIHLKKSDQKCKVDGIIGG